MLHRFDTAVDNALAPQTFERFMHSELDFYLNSDAGKRVMAQQYVGLPYESLRVSS